MYIWEKEAWPRFEWNAHRLIDIVAEARAEQALLLSRMNEIGLDARMESELVAMSSDVIKTSAIEGEVLNPASVRSSIARRLGLDDGGLAPADRKVEGVVEMAIDVTRNHAKPLTQERVFGWHAALFPTGYSGLSRIDVGSWRRDTHGPMQVVSGAAGRRKVHFEAPPAARVSKDMDVFLRWFGEGGHGLNGILRAGLAHLWFVTIHPLDDGNGRTARAVADLAIAQMEGTGRRFYSMSSQIEREKKFYYELLEATQKGDLDITDWLEWFCECYRRAIMNAGIEVVSVVRKARFLKRHAEGPGLSERQSKVVRRLFEPFEGKLTASKYAALAKCSVDTANRDISDLVARNILIRNPGGSKNTSYSLDFPEDIVEPGEPMPGRSP